MFAFGMFASIARFEFRYQVRNPVFWVAAALFFLLAFGLMATDDLQIGSGGNVRANSPHALVAMQSVLLLFYMFAATAFVANVVVRDDETRYGSIVRSTRITKFDYLFGRFSGAFAAAALAYLAVPAGLFLGTLMPWLDAETLGPNRFAAYATPYLMFALPGIFLMSAIFFALATATRSMMATYLGVVVFLMLYLVTTRTLGSRVDLLALRALIEPFGISAYGLATRYATAAERNADIVALTGPLLWNRLLWTGVALSFLGLAYAIYRFAERGLSARGQRRQNREAAAAAVPPVVTVALAGLPAPGFGSHATRMQLWSRAALEMKQVFKSPAFVVLMVIWLGFTLVALLNDGGALYGTPTLPVTRSVMLDLQSTAALFGTIIATYYAGELVWRERERKVHEIIDATPLPNWAYVVPKTIALSLVLLAALGVAALAAMTFQLVHGGVDLEPGKYLLWFILPSGAYAILIAVLAIFLQAMSPSKYVGWGAMLVFIVLQTAMAALGLEHNLYLYGQGPVVIYSDMNGAGDFWIGQWSFVLLWAAVAMLMLIAAHLLWRRGTETRFMPRLRRARARLAGVPGAMAGVSLAVAAAAGGWIFYNTNILNDYRTSDENQAEIAAYEKRFLAYETLPQPTVGAVTLNVALYPDRARAEVDGRYTIRNLTTRPIRDVHLRHLDDRLEIVSLRFPGARLVLDDKRFDYRIYRLDRPMLPGDTRTLAFRTVREQRGFRNSGGDLRIVGNGTFVNNRELVPEFGMNRDNLLQSRAARRKYGLPAELGLAKLEDPAARERPYVGDGWTRADITVSTVADQTPIAPGKKVSDVTTGGRRTARFVSDAPILNFYSIQSARYAERHMMHRGVDLAVYHHPAHGRNVDRMLAAMRTSLDYYQANFGPYQFDQARIVEYPAYSMFAQAFANTMPYSESIGFIADNSDPDRIDYVTFITAHELAHQYWAHQLIGANMEGGTMLSETLAEYSALMVMKRTYGPDKMRRFLKYELDRYLAARAHDSAEEKPLVRVGNQQYIHYQKGGMAMHLLADRMGEDAVNRALARLLARYRFGGAPYARSTDLIDALRAEAGTPENQALITDLMERITIYDLRVDRPRAVRRPDGRWDVVVPVVAAKAYADGKGGDRAAPLDEPIAIGLFTAEPGRGGFDARNVVLMERRALRSGRQVLRFVTDVQPTHAGVDPYNFRIDRNSGDNVAAVGG